MKICIINSLYRPYNRGGAEIVTQNIIDGLLEQGHQIVLITLGKIKKVEIEGRLKIYRIKPINIFSFIEIMYYPTWLRLFWHLIDVFNISGVFQVKKIIIQEKPELVLTHNLKGVSYLVPGIIKRLGIRHIHTIHDVQLTRPSGLIIYGEEKPFLILDKFYEKMCLNLFTSPDVVVSPSRWLLDYYAVRGFFGKSKKVVMPNPIMNADFSSERLNIDADKKFVNLLYLGQLEESKGIIFLIETLKKLQKSNWELKIVGTGSKEGKIKELIEDKKNFKFYGYIKHSQLVNIFRQTDFTILPSLCYENSPAVVYESMAAGVPVLASDIGGIPELVKDNFNGFTFEPANEKSLLQVVGHFLDHPGVLPELRHNALDSVKDYTIKNYINKLLDLARY